MSKLLSSSISKKSVVPVIILLSISSMLAFAPLLSTSVPRASAASALVQQFSWGCNTGSCPSTVVNLPYPVTMGDVIAVAVAYYAPAPVTTLTVSDTMGTSFNEVAQSCNTLYPTSCAAIAVGTATANAGFESVTVSYSTAPYHDDVYAYEISGVTTESSSSGIGQAQYSPISTTPASFSAGSFLIGATDLVSAGTFTAGSGFTTSFQATQDHSGWAQYSNILSSPTTFPATTTGYYWAEAGIALAPLGTGSDATSVACTSPISSSTSTTCTATVTGATAPTGYAYFPTTSSGSFSSNSCSLAALSATQSSCSVSYTPYSSGPQTITANYGGDAVYAPSSGTFSLIVTTTSTTAVSCTPSSVTIGATTTCSASVGGYSPTGTVTWSTSGSGTFSPSNTCTLSSGNCSVTYSATSGSSTITASYGGDTYNTASTGTFSLSATLPPVSPPCIVDGNVTIYSATDSSSYILVSVNTTVSDMHSAQFLESVFPQYGYLPNGAWGYLGYYQGTFGAVATGTTNMTVGLTVTYNGVSITSSTLSPNKGSTSYVNLVFH